MKVHLTKNFELCQFHVISIFGTWSVLPSVQVRLYFPIPVLLLSHFLSPYSLSSLQTYYKLFFPPYPSPELFNTAFRWCFFYLNLVFPYFCIEYFGIHVEEFVLLVKFVMFIKSSFPLSFTCIFCFSSSLVLGISMTFVILYFLITFLVFLVFGSSFLSISQSIDISPDIVSISFSILIFHFGFLFLSGFLFFFQFNSKFRFNCFCTRIQHCINIIHI